MGFVYLIFFKFWFNSLRKKKYFSSTPSGILGDLLGTMSVRGKSKPWKNQRWDYLPLRPPRARPAPSNFEVPFKTRSVVFYRDLKSRGVAEWF